MLELVSGSDLFKAEWYLANNPDVAAAGLDPVYHFLVFGGSEGRPAGPHFCSASYLAFNVDVARTGLNPLAHHLQQPETEKRYFETVDDFAVSFGEENAEPMRRAVALIAGSSLFDPEWFDARYPQISASGLCGIVYLLRHGFSERLSPGPDFNAGAYLDANPDVMSSGHNPVMHYLTHGKAEGRAAIPVPPLAVAVDAPDESTDDRELIAGSPLFDATWYVNANADVARAGMDPALHYLRYGGVEQRKPSLFFDPAFYLAQLPPSAEQPANTLLHYLKTGRAAGLKPSTLADFSPPSRLLSALPAGIGADLGLAVSRERDVAWARYGELLPHEDDEPVLFFGQTALGVVNGDGIGLETLVALCRLLGIEADAPIALRLRGGHRVEALALTAFSPTRYRGFGTMLTTGHGRIADAWFASDVGLMLRFGDDGRALSPRPLTLRAFQTDLARRHDPVFIGEGLISPSGLSIIPLTLDNPFTPILLCLAEQDGTLIELGLLPFPSLARGGHHHAELVAISTAGDPMDTLRVLSDALLREYLGWDETEPAPLSVSGLSLDLEGAVGIEPIFSVTAREWLSGLFGLGVMSINARDTGTQYLAGMIAGKADLRPGVAAPARRPTGILHMPADALPTLSAIVSRRLPLSGDAHCIGAYVIADLHVHRPRWLVVPSRAQADLIALQPAGLPAPFPILRGAQSDAAGPEPVEGPDLPLALRYRIAIEPRDASILMPGAPDALGHLLKTPPVEIASADPGSLITAIVVDDGTGRAADVLAALRHQTLSLRMDVTLVMRAPSSALAADLERLFAYRHRVMEPCADLKDTLRAAAAQAASPLLLIIEGTTILHDARTVETLHTMMLADAVASASCGLVHESVVRNGRTLKNRTAGSFPSRVSLLGAPRLVLSEPDALDALPAATFPVLANSFAATLVRKDLLVEACLRQAGVHAGSQFALRFALDAITDGYRHLATTVVRATRLSPPPPRDIVDPLGAHFVKPAGWEKLLAAATLLRDIS
ncbi:hypothetical protein [Neorhizobium sp. AL 9.2.2]|uniref:hypothetical protein n=1 Tax=Neorhizobium sp. AL 9.2.2 TaxID=2712894 RepID=UPI0015720A76|nr:hypothetical protein [Neorhizobium sp. AL 9.2.2]NSY19761.1 hypothetical protein [Neorhizobium sp. AL 9.2.2]